MDIQLIKQRFGIIGNSPLLNRAIDIARQVAPTDITVLITGESGTGKENFPKIIHQLSSYKHGSYIAVNCGAIPEGTIDSELFGHEKGSFTGAHESRKGYFEEANGGTIFLDEVAELPQSTQVRLLRVLEAGEFMRVGSSKTIKTKVRVVAATNIDMETAIMNGKFREDLYYRLSTVPIKVPPLRDRKEDIVLLFRKFASDFAEAYRIPPLQLDDEAAELLTNFHWKGNVRQLKNITEQISIIEKERLITADILRKYLPSPHNDLPMLYNFGKEKQGDMSERDILYKLLFDMKKDINELKTIIAHILQDSPVPHNMDIAPMISKIYNDHKFDKKNEAEIELHPTKTYDSNEPFTESEILEESLSLEKREKDMIVKAIEKYKGRRKFAAYELGISERTLYRKLKEYGLE
ncbi:MAG: sigma-54 dependent transcriptional regulator [Bacteroidota bacterium]